MTYPSALEAIAVSDAEQKPTACEPTIENVSFLLLVCSEAWVEDGVQTFACTERGNEWTVTVEQLPLPELLPDNP